MEEVWTWDDAPTKDGWYAVLFCWDANEGVHVGSGLWEEGRWTQHLPVVGYAGPFTDDTAAHRFAVDNDPDM